MHDTTTTDSDSDRPTRTDPTRRETMAAAAATPAATLPLATSDWDWWPFNDEDEEEGDLTVEDGGDEISDQVATIDFGSSLAVTQDEEDDGTVRVDADVPDGAGDSSADDGGIDRWNVDDGTEFINPSSDDSYDLTVDGYRSLHVGPLEPGSGLSSVLTVNLPEISFGQDGTLPYHKFEIVAQFESGGVIEFSNPLGYSPIGSATFDAEAESQYDTIDLVSAIFEVRFDGLWTINATILEESDGSGGDDGGGGEVS